jgi:hypothetical protein
MTVSSSSGPSKRHNHFAGLPRDRTQNAWKPHYGGASSSSRLFGVREPGDVGELGCYE